MATVCVQSWSREHYLASHSQLLILNHILNLVVFHLAAARLPIPRTLVVGTQSILDLRERLRILIADVDQYRLALLSFPKHLIDFLNLLLKHLGSGGVVLRDLLIDRLQGLLADVCVQLVGAQFVVDVVDPSPCQAFILLDRVTVLHLFRSLNVPIVVLRRPR